MHNMMTCSTFSARRMSPLLSVSIAFTPSGVTLQLWHGMRWRNKINKFTNPRLQHNTHACKIYKRRYGQQQCSFVHINMPSIDSANHHHQPLACQVSHDTTTTSPLDSLRQHHHTNIPNGHTQVHQTYPSASAICTSFDSISEVLRSPKRKRMHRDWSAGMILDT